MDKCVFFEIYVQSLLCAPRGLQCTENVRVSVRSDLIIQQDVCGSFIFAFEPGIYNASPSLLMFFFFVVDCMSQEA